MSRSIHNLGKYSTCLLCTLCFILFYYYAKALPVEHVNFMQDGVYKASYESLKTCLDKAKSRFNVKEFEKVNKVVWRKVNSSVEKGLKSGLAKKDAYITAYVLGQAVIGKALKFDWLRKNAKGFQGLYRYQNSNHIGFLAIKAGHDKHAYNVNILIAPKDNPDDVVEIKGMGMARGNIMRIQGQGTVENALSINFEEQIATVTESDKFKQSGFMKNGASFDGDWIKKIK